jgi:hypothetical protein
VDRSPGSVPGLGTAHGDESNMAPKREKTANVPGSDANRIAAEGIGKENIIEKQSGNA